MEFKVIEVVGDSKSTRIVSLPLNVKVLKSGSRVMS